MTVTESGWKRWAPGAVCLVLLLTACGGSAPVEAPRSAGFPQPHHLVPLLRADNHLLTETAALVAKTGNEREIRAAADPLVWLANDVSSAPWRESQRPLVRHMAESGAGTASAEARLLDAWQRRHLVRAYDALGALGGEGVLAHCRAVVADEKRLRYERQLAQSVIDEHTTGLRVANAWATPGAAPITHAAPLTPGSTTSFGGTSAQATEPTTAPRRYDQPVVEGGTIVNVDEVVDRLRPNFEICYRQALREHGRFGAWIIVDASVGSSGEVIAVRGSGDESVPFTMMACLESIVSQARFAPPRGSSSAAISIPLTFTVP